MIFFCLFFITQHIFTIPNKFIGGSIILHQNSTKPLAIIFIETLANPLPSHMWRPFQALLILPSMLTEESNNEINTRIEYVLKENPILSLTNILPLLQRNKDSPKPKWINDKIIPVTIGSLTSNYPDQHRFIFPRYLFQDLSFSRPIFYRPIQ